MRNNDHEGRGIPPDPSQKLHEVPPMTPREPESLTPLDRTRDLALSHLVERFADGEVRPDELAEVERQIALIPNAAERVSFERALRAACGTAMSSIPIDSGCLERVHEAAKLRLRGEADAIAEQSATGIPIPAESAEAESHRIGKITFTRLAIAASLVLAGFLGAQFTGNDHPRGAAFSPDSSASVGIDLSNEGLRAEKLEAARQNAEDFLGHAISLPQGSDIIPNRFDFGPRDGASRSVGFRYAVRVPGQTELAAVTLFIQHETETRVNPGRIVENAQGDVFWSMRQEGPLLYHIQSESRQGVRILSDALGWPVPEWAPAR